MIRRIPNRLASRFTRPGAYRPETEADGFHYLRGSGRFLGFFAVVATEGRDHAWPTERRGDGPVRLGYDGDSISKNGRSSRRPALDHGRGTDPRRHPWLRKNKPGSR